MSTIKWYLPKVYSIEKGKKKHFGAFIYRSCNIHCVVSNIFIHLTHALYYTFHNMAKKPMSNGVFR